MNGVAVRRNGRSGVVLTRVKFGFGSAANMVAVLNAEPIDQVIWVGLQIGGITALRAVMTPPGRVPALVRLDTGAGASSFVYIDTPAVRSTWKEAP